MTEPLRPPRDNLVRALAGGVSIEDDGKTLFGRIAPAGEWAEIHSAVEGHFMERNAPGAFRKTFAENQPKIQFNHGKDPQLGNQLIAEPREFGEDDIGGFYRGEILDGLPTLLMEGLKRGLYGSSQTFSVIREDWEPRPKRSDHNPEGLPERTITEARVMELGPVTWPAYAGAYAGVRSLTDDYYRDILPPVAPSVDAGETHLEPERRDDPEPTPVIIEENPPVDTPKEYATRDEKVARLNELRSSLKAIDEAADGVLPAATQARWDAETAEIVKLEQAVEAIDARKRQLEKLSTREPNVEEPYAPTPIASFGRKYEADIYDLEAIEHGSRSYEERDMKLRDAAQRSVEIAIPGHPKAKTDDFRNGLSRFLDHDDGVEKEAARLIITTGSPAYRRAFNKYLRGEPLSAMEQRAAALAVTGTTTTGGYMVPYIFDPTFINIGAHTSINPYRAACRTVTISGGNNWLAVTSSAVTAAWKAEAAAETEQGPTIGQPTFTVQRASAFATVSIETLQDRPDIGDELGVLFQEAKDTLEENSYTLGVGTTVYPQGMFLSGAFTAVTTTTNDQTALIDATKVETALPIRHRANAVWFMSRSTQRQLEALDTTGYYFKSPGQQFALGMDVIQFAASGRNGTQLLGYPIYETPSAVSTLTTDAAVIAVLCNPSQYVIVDRIGMSVEVIANMLDGATPSFPTGQRGIFAMWRNTARVVNVDGGRQMKVQ